MTDIVERLREEAESYFNAAWIRQDGGNDYRLSGRIADEAADEIERLREALREYVATVVCEEGVAFIDRMPTAELRLLVESVSKEDK